MYLLNGTGIREHYLKGKSLILWEIEKLCWTKTAGNWEHQRSSQSTIKFWKGSVLDWYYLAFCLSKPKNELLSKYLYLYVFMKFQVKLLLISDNTPTETINFIIYTKALLHSLVVSNRVTNYKSSWWQKQLCAHFR